MSLIDPIADALTQIRNAELVSKKECTIKNGSKLLGEILKVAEENHYIKGTKKDENKGRIHYQVTLQGTINSIKAIKPRYAVKKDNFEKYEKRYLPARDVGILLVSTPKGLMTHRKAKELKSGGRLIAYIY